MTIEVQEAEALEVEVLPDLMDEVHRDRWVKVQEAEARLETMMMASAARPDLEVVVLAEKVQVVLAVQEVGIQMDPLLTALMDLVDVDPLATTLGAMMVMMATIVIPSMTTMALWATTAMALRMTTTVTSSATMAKMQTTSMTTNSGVMMRKKPMITAPTTLVVTALATRIKKGGGAMSTEDEICKPREDLKSRTTLARATSTGVLMDTIPQKIASMTGTPPTSRRTPNTTTG